VLDRRFMSQTDVVPELPQILRPRRRRWRRLVLALAVLLALGVGYVLVVLYLSGSNLRSAQAEADRLDPGWRVSELEAARQTVPDAANAALHLLAADKLLPAIGGSSTSFFGCPLILLPGETPQEEWDRRTKLEALAPTERLGAARAAALAGALDHVEAALAEARQVADLPAGRFPPAPSSAEPLRSAPSVWSVRRVSWLLEYDVFLRAEKKQPDLALASCRALLNTARAIGDEPLWSQLARMQLRAACCRSIERVLAQGEPSEHALALLQQLVEKEEAEPLFLIAARGMRADWDDFLAALEAGQNARTVLSRSSLAALGRTTRPSILRVTTRIVEIAKLPVEEQGAELRWSEVLAVPRFDFPSRLYLVPRVEKMTADLHKNQISSAAELRCAVAALAGERYRRAHGRWPESLAALVQAGYLREVPADPFDKQPLRLRVRPDGLVIYSVGPDGRDDGGKIDRATPSPGTDQGFQLWDPDLRAKEAQ
jgi:hypothetical protein